METKALTPFTCQANSEGNLSLMIVEDINSIAYDLVLKWCRAWWRKYSYP